MSDAKKKTRKTMGDVKRWDDWLDGEDIPSIQAFFSDEIAAQPVLTAEELTALSIQRHEATRG